MNLVSLVARFRLRKHGYKQKYRNMRENSSYKKHCMFGRRKTKRAWHAECNLPCLRWLKFFWHSVQMSCQSMSVLKIQVFPRYSSFSTELCELLETSKGMLRCSCKLKDLLGAKQLRRFTIALRVWFTSIVSSKSLA